MLCNTVIYNTEISFDTLKVDRSIMRIVYMNISDIQNYSLAILMKYILIENLLFLFYIKTYMISILISGITELPL